MPATLRARGAGGSQGPRIPYDAAMKVESARSLRDLEDDETRCAGIARRPAFSDQCTEGRHAFAAGSD